MTVMIKFSLKTTTFPNDSIEHLRTEEEQQALIETDNASKNSEIENV